MNYTHSSMIFFFTDLRKKNIRKSHVRPYILSFIFEKPKTGGKNKCECSDPFTLSFFVWHQDAKSK